MVIENRTIALFIDSDNISQNYLKILMDELNEYGNVTYKRIYGDFTSQNKAPWRSLLHEFAIEPIQQYTNTKGKNATDSAMIIDAMDILHKGNVDCVCLATSDSDFTKLAIRFRNDNYIVIGAGEKKTPVSLKAACHRFILMDQLLAEKESKTKKTTQTQKNTEQAEKDKKLRELLKILKEIIQNNADSDGHMHFTAFINKLYEKDNAFNPKNYGSDYKPVKFFKEFTMDGKKPFSLVRRSNYDEIKLNEN